MNSYPFLKYAFLLLAIVPIAAPTITAQITVTNEDGDKIIIMPDGTWKYVDKGKEKERAKAEKVAVNTKPTTPETDPIKDKVKLTNAEQRRLEEEAKQRKEAEKLTATDKPKKEKTADKTTDKPKREKIADNKTDKPKKEKTADKTTDKPKKEKIADNKTNKPEKGSPIVAIEKRDKTVGKNPNSPATVANKSRKPSKDKPALPDGRKPAKIYPYVRPLPECRFSMNEIDPFTGLRKIATRAELWFGFTNEELLSYMGGEYFITCNAFVSQVGNMQSLNLQLIVDSPYAQKQYGGIKQGAMLSLKLINGKVVTLIAKEAHAGELDARKGRTVFNAYYVIDTKEVKELQKSEVSQIRFYWANGFEDYDITEVDFLKNHLNCIENADAPRK